MIWIILMIHINIISGRKTRRWILLIGVCKIHLVQYIPGIRAYARTNLFTRVGRFMVSKHASPNNDKLDITRLSSNLIYGRDW